MCKALCAEGCGWSKYYLGISSAHDVLENLSKEGREACK